MGPTSYQLQPSTLTRTQILKPKKQPAQGASLRSEHSLEDCKQATWARRLKTKKRSRDVQVKKRGSFQIKYRSLHTVPTQPAAFNAKMTLNSVFTACNLLYHHQPSIDRTNIQVRIHDSPGGGLG